MVLFKKKCSYCNKKLEKGEEVIGSVKVPEFKEKVKRAFCSDEHLEDYEEFVKGTPSRSLCLKCTD